MTPHLWLFTAGKKERFLEPLNARNTRNGTETQRDLFIITTPLIFWQNVNVDSIQLLLFRYFTGYNKSRCSFITG